MTSSTCKVPAGMHKMYFSETGATSASGTRWVLARGTSGTNACSAKDECQWHGRNVRVALMLLAAMTQERHAPVTPA